MSKRPYPRREDFYSHGTFNGQSYDAAIREYELEDLPPGYEPDPHYWENGQINYVGTGDDSPSSETPEITIPAAIETTHQNSPLEDELEKLKKESQENLEKEIEKLRKKSDEELQKKIKAKKEEERIKKEQEEKRKRIEKRKEEIQKELERRNKDPIWQAIRSSTPVLIKAGKKEEAKVLIQNYLEQNSK